MSSAKLFSSYSLGPIALQNRVVMAPMTRCRNTVNTPNALMAEYYGQRSSAGLIVTEGTSPSPNGLGYARIPGLFDAAQVEGWKLTTAAAHDGGAKIFVQLMHCGRVGHPANLPAGARLLGPSAVAAPGQMWTDASGMQEMPVPEAMTEADIETALAEYVTSAKLAMEAGFDGVELHGANSYLIDQFLNTASNHRTDAWGGSVANRIRFALEAARRTAAAIGAGRVGIRISPYGKSNGMQPDAAMDELYVTLARELSALGIAFVHLVDHTALGGGGPTPELTAAIRDAFKGTLILCGNYSAASASAVLDSNSAELVAFGRPFISNPDLVSKLASGAELRAPDFGTFYTPGPTGYTDYPVG